MKTTPQTSAETYRGLVLKHPDIAARLTQPPLRYAQPEQWNGYLPPPRWQGQNNTSPRRAALLDIIEAATKAEQENRP